MNAKFTNKVHVIKIFSAEQTDTAETLISDTIDLNDFQAKGFFALDVKVSGDGTANIYYQVRGPMETGWEFIKPTSASNIATGLTKTSGPNGDGRDYFSFQPEPSRYLRICVEETSKASSSFEPVIISAYLIIQ